MDTTATINALIDRERQRAAIPLPEMEAIASSAVAEFFANPPDELKAMMAMSAPEASQAERRPLEGPQSDEPVPDDVLEQMRKIAGVEAKPKADEPEPVEEAATLDAPQSEPVKVADVPAQVSTSKQAQTPAPDLSGIRAQVDAMSENLERLRDYLRNLRELPIPEDAEAGSLEERLVRTEEVCNAVRNVVGGTYTPGALYVGDETGKFQPSLMGELPPIPDPTKDYMLVWAAATETTPAEIKWLETSEDCEEPVE